MALVLFTNLAAYISGAAEILSAMLGMPEWAARLVFYVFAASVVLFGLKAVGVSEKIAIGAIFALVALLAVCSLANIRNPLPLAAGTVNQALAYFGMAMFAFSAFFSVPQGGCRSGRGRGQNPQGGVPGHPEQLCADPGHHRLCAAGL